MSKEKILVVDDGKVMRLVVSKKLQARGFEVTAVAGGREALELLDRDEHFDLVLLDISMPEIDGMEVLARIRQTQDATRMPVIMATANSEDEDVVRAFEMGANDFVAKPINFPVLLARIETQLKLRQATEELERLARQARSSGADGGGSE